VIRGTLLRRRVSRVGRCPVRDVREDPGRTRRREYQDKVDKPFRGSCCWGYVNVFKRASIDREVATVPERHLGGCGPSFRRAARLIIMVVIDVYGDIESNRNTKITSLVNQC
jgi:hypothetical protein